MKKVLALLGVVMFSASAFALNVVAPEKKDCQTQKAQFEQHVATLENKSFIVQNILINMADPMAQQSDNQAQEDAVCYASFRVEGMELVDFVRANADIFRQKAGAEERSAEVFDQLQNELLGFANRVEKLSAQKALDEVAASGNEDWIVQHILSNLADPMSQMNDEQAAPKAGVYKQLKVRTQPLVEYVRQQANRFASFAGNVQDDLTTFANRVEKLTK